MTIAPVTNANKIPASGRLLILGCSQRKSCGIGDVAALSRYDGPAFRLVRKYCSETQQGYLPEILVVSARLGFVLSQQVVSLYDERLRMSNVPELSALLALQSTTVFQSECYEETAIFMGDLYSRAVLPCLEQGKTQHKNILIFKGPPGCRLSALHEWLNAGEVKTNESSLTTPCALLNMPQSKIVLRGRPLTIEPGHWQRVLDEIETQAYVTITPNIWAARIGEHLVPVKWLVARLSGLPRGAFHTDDARRVLNQMGIEVTRQ